MYCAVRTTRFFRKINHNKLISILIPAFRSSALSTVKQILAQAHQLDVEWEIIVADDGQGKFTEENTKAGELEGVTFLHSDTPRSRAATRNELAGHASHPYCLFINGRVGITNLHFLQTYIDERDTADVLVGGVEYPEKVEDACMLHLKYMRAHQDKSEPVVSLGNFMTSTWLFNQIRFDEERDFFGYTERLFTRLLEERKVSVRHIDNSVMPLHFEPKDEFLHDIFEGTEQAWELVQQGKIARRDIPIIDEYYQLKETPLGRTTLRSYSVGQKALWIRYKSLKNPVKTVDRILLLRLSEIDEDFPEPKEDTSA